MSDKELTDSVKDQVAYRVADIFWYDQCRIMRNINDNISDDVSRHIRHRVYSELFIPINITIRDVRETLL